jgi:hypothetical protein
VKQIAGSEPFFLDEYRRHVLEFVLFSNVSSCARRDLLLQFPFDERLPMVEDQEWCKRIPFFSFAGTPVVASTMYRSMV